MGRCVVCRNFLYPLCPGDTFVLSAISYGTSPFRRNIGITKKQREVIDLPLFAILRGFRLSSRQTGLRKFLTEVSATKHAHAAHAHVHHHVAAQLLHGCFLPFLEILRLCFDVGIVSPYCRFVKRFFAVFTNLLNLFAWMRGTLCIFGGASSPEASSEKCAAEDERCTEQLHGAHAFAENDRREQHCRQRLNVSADGDGLRREPADR